MTAICIINWYSINTIFLTDFLYSKQIFNKHSWDTHSKSDCLVGADSGTLFLF